MKRKLNKRAVTLLVSLAVVLTAAVGITLAIIFTGTDSIDNTFTPAKVSCAVVEDGNAGQENGQVTVETKRNVQIKNTGDTDAYIRVAVVVTWKNSSGNVWAAVPVAGTDYNVEYDLSNGWVLSEDGYYYYTKEVAPNGGSTDILINSCVPVEGKAPEGYFLSVEIVASAIQSSPDTVVEQQWKTGVSDANDGKLTVKEATT